VSVRVSLDAAEVARAEWLERFPGGFEERELQHELELVAYVDAVPAALASAEIEDVPADWEQRWRVFHRGVSVGGLWIGPPWERPPAALIPVVIDPGRAFGTGAHPTTRLCIEWLLELDRASLLDVGCGSGVIAIAAAKLGFGPVAALDHDPAAVDATERNARANGVELTVHEVDALRAPLPEAEVAVANIAADAVRALALSVGARTLVTSGYYADAAFALEAFEHAGRRTAEDWVADLWRRRE
jgi:ribosomal protein L11 methyltransferase